MPYFVYVLISEKNGRAYIGSCEDVSVRLSRHNGGKVTATKHQLPYRLAYTEEFDTCGEARKRESWLKRQKSRVLLDELIETSRGLVG